MAGRTGEGGSKGAASATAAPASHVYREVAGFELSLVQKREVKAIWEINQRSNRGLLPPAPGSYSNEFQIFKKFCGSIVDNPFVFGLMTMLTLWALFGSDIKSTSTDSSADEGFDVVISIIFFIFVAEIGMSTISKVEYFPALPNFSRLDSETLWASIVRRLNVGSFYFWLDWVATLSLLFEMNWVTNQGLTVGEESTDGNPSSRAGARAGRIIQLVRMIRLCRLVKLYKYSILLYEDFVAKRRAAKALAEQAAEREARLKAGLPEEDEKAATVVGESQVGARMSDLTNRRVIILILSLLIVVPQLQGSPSDLSINLSAQLIQVAAAKALLNKDPTKAAAYAQAYDFVVQESFRLLPVIKLRQTWANGTQLSVPGALVSNFQSSSFAGYRKSEIKACFAPSDPLLLNIITRVAIDNKQKQIDNGLLSIYTTLFIIGLLLFGTMSFITAIRALVIGPIEKMVALVQEISIDPLGADYKDMTEEDGFIQGMETTTLLITINKIGGLMRVGFGEAGASVIANCLGTSGRLNLIADGVMIRSIFGFCDVRQFTDTTECLQEEVMLFVNRIAHILHSIVVQCSGSANKNIGDAFLLTWKLDGLSTEQTTSLADQALLCFCKALIELARYQTFICNFTAAATQRLYKRFPGYVVRIGSGLHVGWAVEGAIGSNRKIDASYLSPHVNFTEFLESSTKAYGVPLLISEPFFKMLSPAAARYVRQVDRIKKPGEDPIGMYTYDSDIWIDWTEIDEEKARQAKRQATRVAKLQEAADLKDGKKAAAVAAKRRKTAEEAAKTEPAPSSARKSLAGAPDITVFAYTEEVWDDDEDLVQLRHHVDGKFREIWKGGIEAYIEGYWAKAKKNFELALELSNGKDGPSKFLLERIAEDGPDAPADWPGYREEGGGH